MARLPIPGQDDGTWGGILNDFLSHEHNPDGTHKYKVASRVELTLEGATHAVTDTEAESGWFVVSGTGGTLAFPAKGRVWWLLNKTGGLITVQRPGRDDAACGSGVTLIQGST